MAPAGEYRWIAGFMKSCLLFLWFCTFCAFWFIFFFSSRRRHTISYGDWSSDVCSSDLSPFGILTVCDLPKGLGLACGAPANALREIADAQRSEERRVGKECRSRWSP